MKALARRMFPRDHESLAVRSCYMAIAGLLGGVGGIVCMMVHFLRTGG